MTVALVAAAAAAAADRAEPGDARPRAPTSPSPSPSPSPITPALQAKGRTRAENPKGRAAIALDKTCARGVDE